MNFNQVATKDIINYNIHTLQSYKETTLHDSISKLMNQLNKKFSNKINFIKTVWQDISPDWAKELTPYTIKNKTLFFKTKNNPILMQYREQEILRIVHLILAQEIEKIKILNL